MKLADALATVRSMEKSPSAPRRPRSKYFSSSAAAYGPPTVEQFWRKHRFLYSDGAVRGHYYYRKSGRHFRTWGSILWDYCNLETCIDCGRVSGGRTVCERKIYASYRWHHSHWRFRRTELWDEAHGEQARCDACFMRKARSFFPIARDIFAKETEILRLEEQEDDEFYELKGMVDRYRRLLHTRVDKRAELAAKLISERT